MSPPTLPSKPDPNQNATAAAHTTLFSTGLSIRRSVAGAPYVDRSLSNTTAFSQPLQELVTEVGWGWIWARPGLTRQQRSLLNIGMLCALNRSTELGVHVRGALRNGLSEIEIREALVQVGGYVGLPAAMEGFRVAEKALEEWKREEAGGQVKAKL